MNETIRGAIWSLLCGVALGLILWGIATYNTRVPWPAEVSNYHNRHELSSKAIRGCDCDFCREQRWVKQFKRKWKQEDP